MTDRPNPQDMMARLEEMQRQAEATLGRYQELQEELGAQETEAVSEDGYVAVALDGDGRISRIRIDEHAMRQKQTLGSTVIATAEQAQRLHAEKSAVLAERFLSADPRLAGLVERLRPDPPR